MYVTHCVLQVDTAFVKPHLLRRRRRLFWHGVETDIADPTCSVVTTAMRRRVAKKEAEDVGRRKFRLVAAGYQISSKASLHQRWVETSEGSTSPH
jgi:hypothetical protein